MRYFQKLLCLLILVLAASFGVGGCVLLYSDFSVQRSRMAAANAAAHAQACTLLQTEILDLQRRGISTGDAALTARVTAQDVPAALWRGDTLVCATLEGLQSFPLGDAATVTVRTENSIYAVYASDLQGGLRLVTAYDLTGLYRDRNAALMRFLLLEAAVRRAVCELGFSPVDAVEAATLTPAKAFGFDRPNPVTGVPIGLIAPGFAADFNLADPADWTVEQVWCAGRKLK